MDVTSEILRAARAALNKSQRDVAKAGGISLRSLVRLEKNEAVSLDTRRRLQRWFAANGIVFTPDDGQDGPGLKMRRDLLAEHDLDI